MSYLLIKTIQKFLFILDLKIFDERQYQKIVNSCNRHVLIELIIIHWKRIIAIVPDIRSTQFLNECHYFQSMSYRKIGTEESPVKYFRT